MTMVTPNSIQTTPNIIPLLVGEIFEVGNDVSAQLAQGDSITNPAVTLVDVATDVAVKGFTSAPGVSGNTISQVVDASLLTANRSYRMTWTFQANTNKVVSSQTLLMVFIAP